MFTEKWPYTNFHELNLDWILDTLKKQDAAIADFISLNSITYADPIQWDITRQYPKNCVVVDKNGDGYLSVQPVPVGVEIGNTDYWTKIGNFSELWSSVKLAITAADEGLKTTASADRTAGNLVWLNNTLYVCTTAITRGTEYGTNNTAKTTIDARLANLANAVSTLQNNITDVNTALGNKIDKVTGGELGQIVDGNYSMQCNKASAAVDSLEITFSGNQNIISASGTGQPVVIGNFNGGTRVSGPLYTNADIQKFDDLFNKWVVKDGSNRDFNVAVLKDGVTYASIPHSPVDIRTYQTLKMDGTDDITATINTHTKNEPLFIPAGTYKISAPLQLKHSLYGAASSRDPARGASDTILKYVDNPTAFGTLGVITVSGDDVTGNIVIANLDIICNGMIGGIVFTTNKYTDNYIYNVSVTNVKSYGVYLQPSASTLSRYVYMDNVSVWGFSDNKPKERWDDNIAFYWGTRSPDCVCNNLLAMVCQGGFLCNTNVIGTNWITYNGIPSGGSGGADANTWWEGTFGVKVVNNDIHITNVYLDTVRRGFIFDGPGKAAAYICNLIFTCDDNTATTETGYATLALIGTSPSAQLIVDSGIINRSAKISTTVQSIGTYPITSLVCKLDNVYIYTKRDYIFTPGAHYICASNEHRCIDSAITNQVQYNVMGVAETGDPTQYKALAYLSKASTGTQGQIRIFDDYNLDMSVMVRCNPGDSAIPLAIHAIDNRKLNVLLQTASTGTLNLGWELSDSQDSLYYGESDHDIVIYCKLPASRTVTVEISGFSPINSPVMLDRIRNEDGTPMDYPRYNNHDNMTAIKIMRPKIS